MKGFEHPQHKRVDGGGPEAAAKATAHGNADLPLSGGGAGIPGQLLQREAVCAEEEICAEAGCRGIPAPGSALWTWTGGFRRESLLLFPVQGTQGLRTNSEFSAVQQGLHTVFPLAEPRVSAGGSEAGL